MRRITSHGGFISDTRHALHLPRDTQSPEQIFAIDLFLSTLSGQLLLRIAGVSVPRNGPVLVPCIRQAVCKHALAGSIIRGFISNKEEKHEPGRAKSRQALFTTLFALPPTQPAVRQRGRIWVCDQLL
ncbi:hypothetical protein V2G26_014640 [Clonostachys chloroleuca]